jgi:hypothetical protein
MAQELTVNIKTTSDVPQAMDKAKAATTGFAKQVEDISKKFGNSFKDIFLSVLGPMALVGAATAFIGKLIEENQKKQAEANQAAIDGTNDLMSSEDRYWANRRNNENKSKAKVKEAEVERENVTEEFLRKDPRGAGIIKANQLSAFDPRRSMVDMPNFLSSKKSVQDEVQVLIAEDMKKNPEAGVNAAAEDKAQAAAQKASDDAAKAKGTTFKGPEGFSNVVGVGANPVMEAMMSQLEEARKQTALLEIIARPATGGGVPVDFTKDSSSSTPSRASMLTGN